MNVIANVGLPTAARARAEAEQRQASDPAVSAFVAASAGSGKTKLLTDRMLRLMLSGAEPSRIQCLTFTKAAAAEMALRLQHRLGRWVTLDDAWSTTAVPYDVMISGQRNRVTAMGAPALVSGSWDQAATVTRGVDGIVKGLTTGEPIRIATPGRYAL